MKQFQNMKENDILDALKNIIGDSAKSITRRLDKIGSCGGDTEQCFAFDVKFVDWEIQNHKASNGKATLDNADYWMPIIREILPVSESYWHNSNDATIWVHKKHNELQEKINHLIAVLEEKIKSCDEHAELFKQSNFESSQLSSEAMGFAYKISIDKIREILLGTRV